MHDLAFDNVYLLDLAARTKDAVLERLIREHYPTGSETKWEKVVAEGRKIAQQAIDWARGPVLAVLPEEPLQAGNPSGQYCGVGCMRRANSE